MIGHSFIQQILMEHIQYVKNCSKCSGDTAVNKINCSQGVYILVKGRDNEQAGKYIRYASNDKL